MKGNIKKISVVLLVASALAFTGCMSSDGSWGTVLGGLMTSGIGSVLTGNGGTWRSQTDSTVTIQFSTTVAGRENGQSWYLGTVTQNGKTSSFVWVADSYADENKNIKNELFVKEGNAVSSSKPSYRYAVSQMISSITLIFTQEGSSSGTNMSKLPVPNGMYSTAR